jgi:hypothetical protein
VSGLVSAPRAGPRPDQWRARARPSFRPGGCGYRWRAVARGGLSWKSAFHDVAQNLRYGSCKERTGVNARSQQRSPAGCFRPVYRPLLFSPVTSAQGFAGAINLRSSPHAAAVVSSYSVGKVRFSNQPLNQSTQ